VKTIIVAVVLVTGVVVAIWAQSPPIKWPDQVEKSQWPALYEGSIEQTATVCIDVAPKSSLAPSRASYLVRYLLTFKPDAQFRLVIDGEQRAIAPGPVPERRGSLFGFKPGRHTIEITVREPASSVRLSMMLHTSDEGDLPEAIHLCSAAAPPALAGHYGDPFITLPPNVYLPTVNMAQFIARYEAQLQEIGPLSNGPGSGVGIGSGSGGGVGSGAHHLTQVDRDKWPDYIEPMTMSQWPVFFSGQVEKSAAICIQVDPKGNPDLGPFFKVSYSLTVNPAAQFRIRVDDEEVLPPSRPNTSAVGTFSLQRGKHSVEVIVRVPADLVRLAMILQTSDGGHIADGIRLCGAQTAPPLSPKGSGGVSAPMPIYKPEPEYSEEARNAKFQGTVMLSVVVGVDGTAKDIRVVRSLGMGLDEKAVEAVSKWKFKPATVDGRPVPYKANVEVNFRL
jgi:TonB family protein